MKTPYQSIFMIPTNKLLGKQALGEPYEPFEWYKEMREKEPIYFNSQADMWNVFLYEDVKRVLEDKEFFLTLCRRRKNLLFHKVSLGWIRQNIHKSGLL